MSRLKKAVGYVIRTQNYGETSKILKVLTREAGVISLIAKGARRPTSPFGAALEPLTLSEFVYYDREGLKTLSQASLLRAYPELQRDYDRLTAALRCARFVHRLLEEDHREEGAFELFGELLEALSTEEDVRLYELAFQWKLMAGLGVAPQWERCAACGRDLSHASRGLAFSPEKGGLVCGSCRSSSGFAGSAGQGKGEGKGAREIPLSPGTARGLAMLLKLPFPKLKRLRLSEEETALGERLLKGFAAHHLRPVAGLRPGEKEPANAAEPRRRA